MILLLVSCTPNAKSPIIQQVIVSEEQPQRIIPQKDILCPIEMQHIQALYCTNLEQTCLEWIDKKRCKSFAHESKCNGAQIELDFCIDIEEAHGLDGFPLNTITWNQADKICKKSGKRLCNESEWTQACEGPERLPYPYGYDRDSSICNIDHKAYIKNKKLANESVNIKDYPKCLSSYEIHNMAGNMDEAVLSDGGTKYKSVFKGGFWSYIRAACRPRTTEHYEEYADTQTGFRCCKDINN